MRVLVSDTLSEQGLAILRQARGLEVDYKPGLSEADARRRHPRCGRAGHPLGLEGHRPRARGRDEAQGHRARRHRRRQRRRRRPHRKRGIVVMNTPTGNAVTTAEHAIALLLSLARMIPQADRLDEGRQVGEEEVRGPRARRQDARRHRPRQHRPHRRRPRARACA